MSSTRIIKRRIKSSKNISQITKAMEMVSASKMKTAQQMALSSRPYSEKMADIITSLAKIAQNHVDHFLLKDPRINWPQDEPFNILVVLLSTDKSLCGGLNTNLFRGLESWLKDMKTTYNLPSNIKLSFVTIGKKAKEHIIKSNHLLTAEFPQMGDKPRFQDIVPVSGMVINGFQKKEFQMAFTIYMKFISTISQKLAVKQILPIETKTIEIEAMSDDSPPPTKEFQGDYIFEPTPNEIFKTLLPQYIELQLYHVLLESLASEHSARMVAMKNANENAQDIVKDLSLEYNQLRQSKITNELLDVVGARMALE
ncbi:MAG: ATP synthase F1 subunit gamma [Candidatus Beckwithbacteria bacterium]|nr:ATP synthase F1 subunit gamma [Patescibacteria group bacterium]